MRVALDARYLGGGAGGVGAYTRHLLAEIGALDPGLDLVVVTRRREIEVPLPAHRFERVIVDAEPRSLRTLFGLRRLLPADIDLYHNPFNILPAHLRCPAVVTIHDIMWLQSRRAITVNPLAWLFAGAFWRAGMTQSVRHADRLIAVSAATRTAILERFGPEAAPRLTVVHNGLDAYFLEEPPPAEADLAAGVIAPGRPFQLVVGNLSRHKNHHRAVAAFTRAFTDLPEVALVLVRRRVRWDPEMRLLLAHPRLRGRVVLLSEVSRPLLRALYHRAEAFIFPSLLEGFGLPILEAMACGCPVLTSDCGAMAEVAGGAALLVPPLSVPGIAAGMRRLHEDAGLRNSLIARGRTRAAAFTWRRCAEQTLGVYRSLA